MIQGPYIPHSKLDVAMSLLFLLFFFLTFTPATSVSSRNTPTWRSGYRISLPPDCFVSRGSILHLSLSRKSGNIVVFPLSFHIKVQQPFKSSRALCGLCFKSLLMSLLPPSEEYNIQSSGHNRIVILFLLHCLS